MESRLCEQETGCTLERTLIFWESTHDKKQSYKIPTCFCLFMCSNQHLRRACRVPGLCQARGHYDPGLMSHHLVEKTSFQNNLMSRCKRTPVTSTTKERYTAICDMATSNEEKAQSEEPQVGEGLIRQRRKLKTFSPYLQWALSKKLNLKEQTRKHLASSSWLGCLSSLTVTPKKAAVFPFCFCCQEALSQRWNNNTDP